MYDSGNHSGLKNPFIAPAKAFLSLVPNDQASCHMSFFYSGFNVLLLLLYVSIYSSRVSSNNGGANHFS
jgi:hypothetical protein